MLNGHPVNGLCQKLFPRLSLLITALVMAGVALAAPSALADGKAKSSESSMQAAIGQGAAGLPPAVLEMRDGIIAAARTGSLKELLIPIQWNELPPDFGDLPVDETLAEWQKKSPDGSGREWLALLVNLLEAPYAVLRKGPDIENNKIFVWPAFSELPLKTLSPALEVELLRLVSAQEAQRMRAQGHYDGYGLAIGADGTWHAFKQVTSTKTSPK